MSGVDDEVERKKGAGARVWRSPCPPVGQSGLRLSVNVSWRPELHCPVKLHGGKILLAGGVDGMRRFASDWPEVLRRESG